MSRLIILCLLVAGFAHTALAREQIRIVGSSTVFPFTAAAAERFGQVTEYRTPIVESTGTGGGFKFFCEGAGADTPNMSNASRPIKPSEIELCAEHGVHEITELMIGYDGIVLANAINSPHYDLTKAQVFLALARDVPQKGKLVPNPYKRWREIDRSLPNVAISLYGPPPTSGTRDAFVELVMEAGCAEFPEFNAAYPDKDAHKSACTMMREDGVFIEAGENDNLIVQKLVSNPDALGIFGFSFMEQNAGLVKASLIDSINPTFDNIVSQRYSISRSMFVYIKNAHEDVVPGLRNFAKELVSDEALGDDGYLIMKGIIPPTPDQLKDMQARAAALTPIGE